MSVLREIQTARTTNQTVPDNTTAMFLLPSLSSSWTHLHHNLGNYFTRGYYIHKGKYHQEYTDSSLAILPFFHDEAGEFEGCVRQTAMGHNQAVSPEMSMLNRLKWDTSVEGVLRFKHKFKIHFGKASFMSCFSGKDSGSDIKMAADIPRCGHAFIMQDPVALAIADLGKCLLDPTGHSLCNLLLQNKTTVEEWVAIRGNVVFKHILFNSEICQAALNYEDSQNSSRNLHSQQNKTKDLTPHELCDKNHDTFIKNLQPEIINHLVSFITRNIHKLFSVVGIREDFASSLTMLNHVFRLPLHQCEFLSRFSEPSFLAKPKYTHILKRYADNNNLHNKIGLSLFESVQHKNIPSLSRLEINNNNESPLLETYKSIENSLSSLNSSSAISSIPESHNNFDGLFDLDFIEMNTSANNHVNYSDSNADVDINDDASSIELGRSQNGTRISENSATYQDGITKSHINDLHHGNITEPQNGALYDESEDDNEDENNDYLDDVMSEKILNLKVTEFQISAVRSRLYKMFMKNELIMKSLSIDLQIYKAVKRLYSIQKQLYFNSVKPV